MATLGIIGGLSPYSTILYYKLIVEAYRSKAGRDPRLLIYSVPVQEMCRYMREGDLEGASRLISEAILSLRRAGASTVILAANTPHAVVRRNPGILEGVGFIDIVEAVKSRLEELEVSRVGLLATDSTVRNRVYHDILEDRGFTVITPPERVQKQLDELVDRLANGLMSDGDKFVLAQAVNSLLAQGAEAVIYGCTELSLYKDRVKFRVPLVDSLEEHVKAAVSHLLGASDA